MKEIKPCSTKSNATLANEWDHLAEERHRQIATGEDVSFRCVVAPTTLRLLGESNLAMVLDIGCGTGAFTLQLARLAGRVIAVDPSKASLAVARRVCQGVQNVLFFEQFLEDAPMLLDASSATAAVALMTLMTAPDLRGFAKALSGYLRPRAVFVAMITHPCFWPRYWGYENEPWFSYNLETFIEAPFVISARPTDILTTHVHRPLASYLDVFSEEGFRLDRIEEPMPTSEVQALYPKKWEFPRFLGIRWEKVG